MSWMARVSHSEVLRMTDKEKELIFSVQIRKSDYYEENPNMKFHNSHFTMKSKADDHWAKQ